MVLDCWTMSRAERAEARKDRLKASLIKHLTCGQPKNDTLIRPKTTASMTYDSMKCMTPGKELVSKLAAELGRMPTPVVRSSLPELRPSHDPNKPRSVDNPRKMYSRAGTSHSMDSVGSRAVTAERPFRRPDWSKVSAVSYPEKPLSYRDHSYLRKVLEYQKLPGLGGVRTPPHPDAADIYFVQPRPYSPVDTPGPLERGEDNPYLEDRDSDSKPKSSASSRAAMGDLKECATTKAMEKLRRCLYKKHAAHLDCGRAARYAERRMCKAFDKFDLDADGVISFGEFEVMCHEIMPELSAAKIQALFESLDANKDGEIDLVDFMQAHLNLDTAPKLQRELIDRADPILTGKDYLPDARVKRQKSSYRRDRSKMELTEINESISRKTDIEDPEGQIALKLMRDKCSRLPVSRGSKLH
eukprot:CAMPEP_0118951972 /NCGR_PEP_ID=MMETSP1169-20130426/54004_1 /TAXON_ID=36882 /ORGANISM="Pyramimonas obovata, Strain CCMP722" /LENGTH=413 /DNA_ID=CAMNT_0006899127 /DNA_START=105 /DNA_END=1343 /DNA_ORIENTATION=+